MNAPRPDTTPQPRRPTITATATATAAAAMLAATLVACAQVPQSVSDVLSHACDNARDQLAAAPAPTDTDTDTAFTTTSQQAAATVAGIADDIAARGDDPTIADLAWQLHRLSTTRLADQPLATAHEAQAGIMRIDGLAKTLQIPACQAPTWRPTGWRAIADRHAQRPDDTAFRRHLDRLCAQTFPEPTLLTSGMPLLDALVADTATDPTQTTKTRVIARLNTINTHPSQTARFINEFSNQLPQLQPTTTLEHDYLALLAAFMRLDSAVPSAMPNNPPPHIRERVNAALDELQHTWDTLDITC